MEGMDPANKKWYESKTMWVAIATSLAGMTGAATALLPVLAPIITAKAMAWTLFGVGLANIVLRTVTDSGIE
jgi:hypothetical protein